MGHQISDKKCSEKTCQQFYTPHHWGAKKASREGWFLQKNGLAWCPEHHPEWVAEWRVRTGKE